MHVLCVVASYCVDLVFGIGHVRAERDSNNDPSVNDHPEIYLEAPTLEYAKMRTGTFITNILQAYREHLEMHWTPKEIDVIEIDHKALVTAFKTEPQLVSKLENHSMKTMFNDAWDDCGNRFLALREFAGSLLCAFANTTSVESDFSLLKFDFCSNRKSCSNLSIGAIMHGKQHDYVKTLQPPSF
eukprot:Plantae.Rhodophyta-Palmaria_palmata.ctg4154.p1 GENE.Plantae.Rhodophyta-Palmaria_palmata.ctg4154~~Plantae.Rhodophyta-Palmaria_palmata.ctg4154.p1  ORF type:complete len:185 (-),score=16.55 Plantae.Rhodophyta-Palmaria_palmata.ctg4154:96-650(-)